MEKEDICEREQLNGRIMITKTIVDKIPITHIVKLKDILLQEDDDIRYGLRFSGF